VRGPDGAPLDEAAALLLVDMLGKYGIAARVVSSDETSATNIRELPLRGCAADLRFLSGGPAPSRTARYQVAAACGKRMPDVPVMALFWGLASDNSRLISTAIEATECDNRPPPA